MEGWHNAFHISVFRPIIQRFIGFSAFQNVVGDHPSIYKFLKDITREEHHATITWNQVLAGTQTQNKRKKYEKLDSRIKMIVKDFHNVARDDYFKMARSMFNF